MTEEKSLAKEIRRRRTFAIIAHPDAGKTTLTEKLLLYGGAIQLAGAVKSRKEKKATSDWMEMEKERGISITSAALQFEYNDMILNLLDTPGHEDFSEDTYRTLMAADAAVMVIDAGKGVEPQTIKLFKVCRERNIPILTFVNKMDRPAKDLFALLDEIEKVLGITAIPRVWPLGSGMDFKGVYDLEQKMLHVFERTPGGGKKASVRVSGIDDPALKEGVPDFVFNEFLEGMELISSGMEEFSEEKFLQCQMSPVFFGSAVNNFGIQLFLDYFIKMAPSPENLVLQGGEKINPSSLPFSGFIFKVQANMNKAHRDRIAFLRISTGKFERGLSANHNRTQKQVKLSSSFAFFGQDRNTVDEAYPGDIIGLVNPGTFRIGDIVSSGPPPALRPLPIFAPELFATISARDTTALKSFKKGIEQLSEEGILHSYTSQQVGGGYPVIGAMGRLQFDVFQQRLKDEYGAETNVHVLPYTVTRWVKPDDIPRLPAGTNQLTDKNGNVALVFESDWELNYFKKNNEGISLLEHPPS